LLIYKPQNKSRKIFLNPSTAKINLCNFFQNFCNDENDDESDAEWDQETDDFERNIFDFLIDGE